MFLKNNGLLILWLTLLLMLLTVCESGNKKSITGDYIDRKPGNQKSITAHFDSIIPYKVGIGDASYLFAGRYRTVSAFSVVKFPQLTKELLDSLEKATVEFNVGNTWRDGPAVFGLFETTSDWSDSVSLEPEVFLSNLTSPISTFSDTASSIGSLDFVLEPEFFTTMATWNGNGSFLVTNTGEGNTMVGMSSVYSNYKPYIEFIVRKAQGVLDTTKTTCTLTNYYFNTGFDNAAPGSGLTGMVSNADARAFVLKMTLPDSLPAASTINGCIVKLNILQSIIPGSTGFEIGFYLLTSTVTTFTSAQYNDTFTIQKTVTEADNSISLDLKDFIDSWHMINAKNYGILVKPITICNSPSQIICAPEDSITIFYMGIPEVE